MLGADVLGRPAGPDRRTPSRWPSEGPRSNHDVIVSRVLATARADVGLLTSRGRCVRLNALDLPTVPATAAAPNLQGGTHVSELVTLEPGERALALTTLRADSPGLALGTAAGVVKRVAPEVLNRDAWEVDPARRRRRGRRRGGADRRAGRPDRWRRPRLRHQRRPAAALPRQRRTTAGPRRRRAWRASGSRRRRRRCSSASPTRTTGVVVTVAGSSSALPGHRRRDGQGDAADRVPGQGPRDRRRPLPPLPQGRGHPAARLGRARRPPSPPPPAVPRSTCRRPTGGATVPGCRPASRSPPWRAAAPDEPLGRGRSHGLQRGPGRLADRQGRAGQRADGPRRRAPGRRGLVERQRRAPADPRQRVLRPPRGARRGGTARATSCCSPTGAATATSGCSGDEGSDVLRVLGEADRRGVDVRGLIWRSHLDALSFSAHENRTLGIRLQEQGAEALLDMRVRTGGSHHQKLVVIRYRGRPRGRRRLRRRHRPLPQPPRRRPPRGRPAAPADGAGVRAHPGLARRPGRHLAGRPSATSRPCSGSGGRTRRR